MNFKIFTTILLSCLLFISCSRKILIETQPAGAELIIRNLSNIQNNNNAKSYTTPIKLTIQKDSEIVIEKEGYDPKKIIGEDILESKNNPYKVQLSKKKVKKKQTKIEKKDANKEDNQNSEEEQDQEENLSLEELMEEAGIRINCKEDFFTFIDDPSEYYTFCETSVENPEDFFNKNVIPQKKGIDITIWIAKIENMQKGEVVNPGYYISQAVKEREMLKHGEIWKQEGLFVVDPQFVNMENGKNGVIYNTFSYHSVTEIFFYRTIIFYNRGYLIQITLYGDQNQIIREMKDFFKIDKYNILMWKSDRMGELPQALKANQDKNSEAYIWYHSIDKLVECLEIDSVNFPAGDELTLKENPAKDSKKIRDLITGENLELITTGEREELDGITGIWLKIITDNGDIGWIFETNNKIPVE